MAGAHAARRDPELQRFYRRKLVQKGLGKARVAVAPVRDAWNGFGEQSPSG